MEHDEHRHATRRQRRQAVGQPEVARRASRFGVALPAVFALWLALAPNAAAHASRPTGVLVLQDVTSNGLAIVAMLSCVVAVVGIFMSSLALHALLRNGYGPFLRSLIRGKRTGNRRAARRGHAVRSHGGSRGYNASAPRASYQASVVRGSHGDGGRAQAAMVRSTSVARRVQPTAPRRARAR